MKGSNFVTYVLLIISGTSHASEARWNEAMGKRNSLESYQIFTFRFLIISKETGLRTLTIASISTASSQAAETYLTSSQVRAHRA